MNKTRAIILLMVVLFYGCTSSVFTEKELKIINLGNEIAKKQTNYYNRKCETQADKVYEVIVDRGNKPVEVKVYEQMQSFFEKSDKTILLINHAEQDIVNSKLTEQSANKLSDALYSLQTVFREQMSFDSYYTNNQLPYFFIFPDSNSLYKDEKPLSFYFAYFKNAPIDLAMLNLNRIKLSILTAKRVVVNIYASRVSDCGWYFDKIVPFVIPQSNIVDNDSSYKAKVFLGVISRTTPNIIINDKKLERRPSGYHSNYQYVEFPAPKLGHYDSNGLSKQHWMAKVIINKRIPDTLTITRDYYVRKPCR